MTESIPTATDTAQADQPAMPPRACDTHMHVFGPVKDFPLDPRRGYDPPLALLAHYETLASRLGLHRAVIVQPSPYGMDNRCTLAALAALGARGRAVLVIDPTTPEAQLQRWHSQGARGVRFNLVQVSQRASLDALEMLAARIAPLGWHVQLYAGPSQLEALASRLQALPVDVVIDHFGQPDARAGLDQPGFRALRRLVDAGRCWVKLSGAYRMAGDCPPFSLAAPFAAALLAQAPERMLWATDWPHVDLPARPDGSPGEPPDAATLLTALAHWCAGSETTWRRVLQDNPAGLYGFTPD